MTYLIYKDYYSGQHHIGYEYLEIDAKTDFEAIEAAEKEFDPEKTYLVRIMKKEGKPETYYPDGWKKQLYKAVMCKRSHERGWHANTEENSENPHYAYRYYKKGLSYIEATTRKGNMLTANFFDIVEHCRVEQHRNMWSDLLEMDLVYIMLGWN